MIRVYFFFVMLLFLAVSSAFGKNAETSPSGGVKPAASSVQEKAPDPITRSSCLECHADNDPVVDEKVINASAHKSLNCIECHADIKTLPHENNVAKVNCGICHQKETEEFKQSIHSQIKIINISGGPSCTDCHGTHDIYPKSDERSRSNHFKSDAACLQCHTDKELIKRHPAMPPSDFVRQYLNSVHGKAVHEKGLSVAATCSDCHGPHAILPASNPRSMVAPENIAKTCAKCHQGIYDQYVVSIHGRVWRAGVKDAPTCSTCHAEHGVVDPKSNAALMNIPRECGQCHQRQTASYKDTFHGKSTFLGFTKAAKCTDCHGAHFVLPAGDPKSMINKANLQQTCAKCHGDVNTNFVHYDPHNVPQDKERSPMVFYIYTFMNWLLIAVFAFWGLHTVLWFQRSVVALLRREFKIDPHGKQFIRRFTNLQRRMHGVVVVSFLGLVMTGLPLKYYYTGWGQYLNTVLGGVATNRYFHRIFGLVTLGYFVFHLAHVLYRAVVHKDKGLVRGHTTLVPRHKDWRDFIANLKWFFYRGPRPKYDRWTYFEKFDYLAVFWGVLIIGASGLIMWFPTFFTKFFPGPILNVAAIVHSDEALLALAFIFTVHFFHNHLRVENFPIDLTIFSGVQPLDRFRKERPHEYRRLVRTGKLQQYLVPAPSKKTLIKCYIFGFTSLGIGFMLIWAIILTFLTHH